MPSKLLEARNLGCSRGKWMGGRGSQFRGVSLALARGETLGISGPDGCGKGLLLNVLGLLEPPDAGELFLEGIEPFVLEGHELARLRNQSVGFVFESPCLLPAFTVLENVAMPFFRIRQAGLEAAQERAREVLEFCGLWGLRGCLAGRISGREAAAAATARALMHSPSLIVAINPRFPEFVFPILARAAENFSVAVLAAGPEEELGACFQKTRRMRQGVLEGEG